MKEFEPLLLTRQTGGLTRLGQPLYMRARIPARGKKNYDVYKNGSTKQSRDHVTNQSLYQLTGQVPLRQTICERQLKFTGHCIRMPTDEPANRFVIYESRIKSSLRPGAPRTTYLNHISSHILQFGEKFLEEGEIRKMVVNNRSSKLVR